MVTIRRGSHKALRNASVLGLITKSIYKPDAARIARLINEMESEKGQFYLAFKARRPVGLLAVLEIQPHHFEIRTIIVEAEERSTGVGRLLINALITSDHRISIEAELGFRRLRFEKAFCPVHISVSDPCDIHGSHRMIGHPFRVVHTETDIDLLPSPNQARHILTENLPDRALISAVTVFALSGEGLLMTRHRRRGWDLPAGHIEEGETPEQAARRECFEETATHLANLTPMGVVELTTYASKPEGYRYPYPTSYIVFFFATVAALENFEPDEEAIERGFIRPEQARKTRVINGETDLYEEALRRFSNIS